MLRPKMMTGCAGCAAHPAAWAEDDIDRREFIVRGAIVAASAALAACGGSNPIAPELASGTTVTVTDYPSLANVGGIALVNTGGAPIAIVRSGTTSYLALSRVCPHKGTIVNQDGTTGFLCPNHGARFDTTGKWLGGQQTNNLRSYPTSYDAATGVLTIN